MKRFFNRLPCSISEKDRDSTKQILVSLSSMLKLDSNTLVNYVDCWQQNDCLYLQMRFFTINFKNILDDRSTVFPKRPVGVIEYFILVNIFKDLITCVDYWHNRDVPIKHGSQSYNKWMTA